MRKKKDIFRVSEISLKYKNKVRASERPQITNSKVAYLILLEYWSEEIELLEEFYILLLNRSNKVMGIVHISKGGVAGTVVDAKIIFAVALKAMACSVILAHNHPSGNLSPSRADIDITKKLRRAGEALDISVLDHLIITQDGYYSFADEGKL